MIKDSLPKVEVEIVRFNSIVDIPKHICTLSNDSNEFIVYNIENNKICAKIPNPISFELKLKGMICPLNGSQLFYFGGRTPNKEILGHCFLIDIKLQSVEVLPHRLPSYFTHPIYYENFVYIFGASGTKESNIRCDKYSIRKNKWKMIADLPSLSGQISTIVYENKLLITGYGLKWIYNYDPDENSYEKVFEVPQNLWKGFCVSKSRCYVITGESDVYISEVKDWKHWHFYAQLDLYYWPFSNVCYHENSVWYFDDKSNICKFKLKNLKFQKIATIN